MTAPNDFECASRSVTPGFASASPTSNAPQTREGVEEIVRVLGLDFVEVFDGLAAGLDGGGEDAGLFGLTDIVIGVADAGPEDIVDRIGVACGNLQLPRRPAYSGHDRPIRLHQCPAEVRNNQIDASAIVQPAHLRCPWESVKSADSIICARFPGSQKSQTDDPCRV